MWTYFSTHVCYEACTIAPSIHETAEKIIVSEARENVEALLAAVRQDAREAVLPGAWETAAQFYWLLGLI